MYITESGAAGDRKSLKFIVVSGHRVQTLHIDKNVFLSAKVLCSKVHSLSLTLLNFWGFEGLHIHLLSAQQHSIPGPIIHRETRNYSEVPLPPTPPHMSSGTLWCQPVLPEALDT